MGLCSTLTLAVALLQWAALTGLAAGSSLQNGCLRGGGVDASLQTWEQEEAQEFQQDLACRENDTAIEEIRVKYGLGGNS